VYPRFGGTSVTTHVVEDGKEHKGSHDSVALSRRLGCFLAETSEDVHPEGLEEEADKEAPTATADDMSQSVYGFTNQQRRFPKTYPSLSTRIIRGITATKLRQLPIIG
jgi:hypothetical protein